MTKELNIKHEGSKFTVEHCEGAIESFEEALISVTPHNKKSSIKRAIIQLIERLADGKQMSKENFPQEGQLPKSNGKFNAFKKLPIRAYCWLSSKHPNTYFISHYTYKDKQKLDQRDIDKVHANWRDKED
ncbi:hypothetical protein [Rheinheimera soli]|uniref:hypothetical protein n=1 Tax=Rheinheimera soli TaxID=443616 RepID=UPI001E499823|nr:hypothetical protein [Rheinheimera soli]